jgi:predicted AlkP superfamily phosphohydrolase/phosphomutase
LARLRQALESLESLEEKGLPTRLVEHVADRSIYHGAFEAKAPDLSPILRDHSYYFCQVYSFYLHGEKRIVCPVDQVVNPAATGCVGDHHPHGILIAAGPSVPRGRVAEDASILDIAPTILAHFGVAPLPEHEGCILSDFFGAKSRAQARKKVSEAPQSTDGLRRRLMDLGYRI